jgi:hypothetical protein
LKILLKKNAKEDLSMRINNLIFSTSPLIVHAPAFAYFSKKMIVHDALNQYWTPIVRNLDRVSPTICRKETKDELTIITWNTKETKKYCEISLDKLGLDYLVLGKNVGNWCNINKITTALEIVDAIKTPYVMGLDSFDVIVLRDPYEAVEKFKTMDCDMLFNGEKTYYPDCGLMVTGNYAITDKWKKHEMSLAKSEWKFLNSGAFIVKTKFYKDFLTKCLERHDIIMNDAKSLPLPQDTLFKKYFNLKINNSDQLIAHWMHYDYYPRIEIDYKMEIFFNTMDTALDDRVLVITDNIFTGYSSKKYRVKLKTVRFLEKIYSAIRRKVMIVILRNLFGKNNY